MDAPGFVHPNEFLRDVLLLFTRGAARDFVDTHENEGVHACWKLSTRVFISEIERQFMKFATS